MHSQTVPYAAAGEVGVMKSRLVSMSLMSYELQDVGAGGTVTNPTVGAAFDAYVPEQAVVVKWCSSDARTGSSWSAQ